MQLQGTYCPLLLSASLLLGLTQIISQVKIIISISYTMGPHRQSCSVLLPKQQRHSREVLSCTRAESWLHWCWGSPWALSTLRCKALLVPHGMQHKSSRSWKICQLEVAQHGAWEGRDWMVQTPPVRVGTTAWVGRAGGSWDQPHRLCSSTVPSPSPSNRCTLRQALLFFRSFALQQI